MLATSLLQPRKSEVKHGVRHRKQRRKQEARRQHANRSTTPSTSETASIARESRTPLRAPEPPARARAPQRAPGPQRMPGPPARQSPPAHARPPARARAPRVPGRKPGGFAAGHVLTSRAPSARRDENRAPERQPSRPSDFETLIEPSSEFPRRKIVNLVQPWSILTILRSLKAKTRDYLRYRKAHTRTTDKNVHFSLPRPRKTVCFDRQQPKQPVFRIAHPPRQPNPMLNKQHSRHRSRRWRASSPGLRTLITGIGFYHHRDWSGVTLPEFCRILDAYLRH